MGSIHALAMALADGSNLTGLIHHSDRGVQYCCTEYVKILNEKTVRISMTENSDPLENAIAERVNGILKDEFLKDKYLDFKEAKTGIAEAILIYNSIRLHSSCDMLTPDVAHQKQGPLKRHWKSYYKKRRYLLRRQDRGTQSLVLHPGNPGEVLPEARQGAIKGTLVKERMICVDVRKYS